VIDPSAEQLDQLLGMFDTPMSPEHFAGDSCST
jgi:hypothetical protein